MSYFPNQAIGATGATGPNFAELVGGVDGTNKLRGISTDTSGNVNTNVVNSPAVTVSGSVVVTQATAANFKATVVGTLTNNNAAPAATNVGVLPALANAANPSYTEGDQVLQSVDLSGKTRIQGASAVGSAVPSNAVYDGLISTTAYPTAATGGNLVGAMADKAGRQAVVLNTVRDLVGTAVLNSSSSSLVSFIASVAQVSTPTSSPSLRPMRQVPQRTYLYLMELQHISLLYPQTGVS